MYFLLLHLCVPWSQKGQDETSDESHEPCNRGEKRIYFHEVAGEGAEPPRELCQHLEDAYNFKTALFFLYIYFFKSWDRGGVGNCSLSENRRHGRSWSCQAPAFSRKSLDLACTEKQNYSSVNLVFCMFCALKCNCFENKTNLVMWC